MKIFTKFGTNIILIETTTRFAFKNAVFNDVNMVAVRTTELYARLYLTEQISKFEMRVESHFDCSIIMKS
jgi:hypothetical protein